MKNQIIFLFLFLFALQAVSAKDKNKKDAKDLKIDTLTRANDSLRHEVDSLLRYNYSLYTYYDTSLKMTRLRHDSVSVVLGKVYGIIREKLIKLDFNPDRLPQLIDSISALSSVRDSSLIGKIPVSPLLMTNASQEPSSNSLIMLKKENAKLKALLEGFESGYTLKKRKIEELKELKGLLDTQVLTRSEFDALKTKILKEW